MHTAPLWVPLAVALIGVVGTIAGTVSGVLIAQRSADRREKAHHEQELDRERARWTREDEARTFEHRRQAYVAFYEALRNTVMRINYRFSAGQNRSDLRLPNGWQSELFERLQHVEMYGSSTVVDRARNALQVTLIWEPRAHPGVNDEELDIQTSKTQDALLAAIRQDLGVPDSDVNAAKDL